MNTTDNLHYEREEANKRIKSLEKNILITKIGLALASMAVIGAATLIGIVFQGNLIGGAIGALFGVLFVSIAVKMA